MVLASGECEASPSDYRPVSTRLLKIFAHRCGYLQIQSVLCNFVGDLRTVHNDQGQALGLAAKLLYHMFERRAFRTG